MLGWLLEGKTLNKYGFCDLENSEIWKIAFSNKSVVDVKPRDLSKLRKIISKEDPLKDAVLIADYKYKNPWMKALDADDVPPYILFVHETMVIPEFQTVKPQAYYDRERRLFAKAKVLVCYNEFIRDEIRYRHYLEGKAVVVPWGVGDGNERPSDKISLDKRRIYVPHTFKGISEKMTQLRNQFNEFKVYHSPDDVPNFSVVILSSLTRTQKPLEVLEFMKKGCLVIGDKTHRWLIKPNYDGIILDFNDLQDIQTKLLSLMKEENKAETFAKNLQEKFFFQHTYKKNAERIDMFYERGFTLQDRVKF